MKTRLILAAVVSLALSSIVAYAGGTCAGPSPCPPDNEPTGPAELCLPDGCTPVTYSWFGDFALAEGALVNGYRILGWAGPCDWPDHTKCPDIFNQAFADMRLYGIRANRAQRY